MAPEPSSARARRPPRGLAVRTSLLALALGGGLALGAQARGGEPTTSVRTSRLPAPATTVPAPVVFEVSYSNAAWGYVYTGLVILRDGSVYRFREDRPDELWNPSDALDRARFEHPFQNLEPAGTLDGEELARALARVEAASRGEVRSRTVASDAGLEEARALVLDAGTGRYRVVRLGTLGRSDLEVTNDAPEAQWLLRWLKRVQAEVRARLDGAGSGTRSR